MPIQPVDPELLYEAATNPTRRRLAISYRNDSGETPVSPVIDDGYDIAESTLNRMVEYATQQTQANSIPIAGLPIVPAGFGVTQEPEQRRYVDRAVSGIPNAENELNSKPTFFPEQTVVPDTLGIHQKTTQPGTRAFQLAFYNRTAVNSNSGKAHGDLLDSVILATRGQNSNNRFFQPTDSSDNPDNRIRLGSVFYKQPGTYATGSSVRSTPNGENPTDFGALTIESLKDVGLNMMFEGVQGAAGLDFVVRSSDPTSIIEAEARMAVPSEQRIGKRVSLGRFTAAYQLKKMTGAEKPSNPGFIDTDNAVMSYGSFYNAYSQFDSLLPAGQVALAVAMILSYVTVLNGIVALVRVSNPPDEESNFVNLTAQEKRQLLGVSTLQDSSVYPTSANSATDVLTQFLGVEGIFTTTRHSAEDALNAGIREFFGFSFSGNGPATAAIANTSLRVLSESGRLNVILREILRSGITLVEIASSDFSGGVGITGIGNLVRKIRDLKITRFINVLMQVGDKVLFQSDIDGQTQANVQNPGGSGDGGTMSYVDSLPDSRDFLVAKSRLSTGEMAWSSRTAGMLQIPLWGGNGSFAGAGVDRSQASRAGHWQEMGLQVVPIGDDTLGGVTLSAEEKAQTLQRDRLPAEVVKRMEDTLEADYMPFYMQDLRTNEILSFHAFLEEVADDFNVEYSAQEGYGRMDKVQIYKGTTRNINVSFKMVATNPEDHDLMWYKLNKLAMFIYPQWTQGRKIEVGNLHFIQPFSQIPGATPVVRLRLGDLFKSNYSKMAVARLFGITTDEEYNVNGQYQRTRTAGNVSQPTVPETTDTERRINLLRSTKPFIPGVSDENSNSITPSDVFRPDDIVVLDPAHTPGINRFRVTIGGRSVPVRGGRGIRVKARYVGTEETRRTGRGRRTLGSGNNTTVVIFKPFEYVLPGNGAPLPVTPSAGASDEIRVPIRSLNGSHACLHRTMTAVELWKSDQNNRTSETRTENSTAVSEVRAADMNPATFYDESKNPIVRAFKSSGGKGLAGVVTSFKIDYSEAKGQWGIDGGDYLRAPKFVTVTMAMAVIHDITPGLDAKGIMWAPIWPVGHRSTFFTNNGQDNPPRPSTGNPSPVDYFDPGRKTLFVNRKG